jgi:hypothetical protein
MTELLFFLGVIYITYRLCAGAMVLPEAIVTNNIGKFIDAVMGW